MDLRRRKIQPVEVGGETFHLRSWSLSDRLTWAEMVRAKKPQADIVTYVLRTSLCDADGKPTLTTETADDFDADLGEALLLKILASNGMGGNAAEDAKKN